MTETAILYVSQALTDFTVEELEVLQQISYSNNLVLEISGYLYFENHRFFQYLEGEDSVVHQAFERIKKDPRHKIIGVLEQQDIVRRFPDWSMKWLQSSIFANLNLEKLLIDHLSIMSNFKNDGPDFSGSAFQIVDTLSKHQIQLS
ncbi:hypothetical protein A3762_24075 [Oleiphilus sp. HI0125]|uniref:BLUF domain-containing protein n=1 Tax=Oleiphilus sp. HI0125 TaxID=1822266 RepID=UPI0007C36C80|nr:BLUF domain-containing protein [Oleiphilus sp. HI0125]KZZ59467.1 hypothetical protein A3762_05085 [Oleiphilus sp. HI0125]KZZ61889.1 hypothetical protein A3762_24075 [Oleiphilus sp. HI0125]